MSIIDFKTIADSKITQSQVKDKLIILDTAKRHAIKINNIYAYRNEYALSNSFKSRELVSQPIKAIALFCNEYVPEHFIEDKYFKYVFTINGVDHEVVPMNTQRPGKKVIRTSQGNSIADYITYISEPIRSAYLTVSIKAPNKNETPYISNVKILIGGNV